MRTFLSRALRIIHQLLRGFSLLLILLGLCTLYDQGMGDGTLPGLNDISTVAELRTLAGQNRTQDLKTSGDWDALRPARRLLVNLSPTLGDWLYTLHQQNRIVYHSPVGVQAHYHQTQTVPVLAAYEFWSGRLYLGPDFWKLSEGEKVAVLAHEARHARQNWAKIISQRLALLITRGHLPYDNPLEAEAFDFERQARVALGLSPLTAQALH